MCLPIILLVVLYVGDNIKHEVVMEVEKLVICISMLMRFEKYDLSEIDRDT